MEKSMKTTVIMVRHGETQLNVECKFLGTLNAPLNERGRIQAGYAREALKNRHIDRIYSSPYKRALQTAEIIDEGRDIPVTIEPELREINCGRWEGKDGHEVEKLWPGEIEKWGTKPSEVRIEDGDTFEEVWDRIYRAFWKIADANKGKTILITSHMVCLQLLLIRLKGGAVDDMWNVVPLANAALNIVEIDEKRQAKIIAWSDESFVPEAERQKAVPVAGRNYTDER